MEKVLTIIIPTYNMEKYLHRTLDSLIVSDEDMSLLEVLVINDGSKDSSSLIGHEYEAIFPDTFRVIDKENGNYGSCINRGLKEASGKYVKILDADDRYDNEVFRGYLKFLKNTDVDLVINNRTNLDDRGKVVEKYSFKLPFGVFSLKDIYGYVKTIQMHCVAIRTDNIRKIGYKQTEGISYTDQEWMFLPVATSESLAYFDGYLYLYLTGRDGQTMDVSVRENKFWQELKVMDVSLNEYNRSEYMFNEEQRQYLVERLVARIASCYSVYFNVFGSDKNYQLLVDFDKALKEKNQTVYERLNGLSVNHYHYIRHWRKHYPHKLFLCNVYRRYLGLRRNIRSLFY